MKVRGKIFDCANFNEDEINEFLHGAIHVETFTKQAIGSNPNHRELVIFAFYPDEGRKVLFPSIDTLAVGGQGGS